MQSAQIRIAKHAGSWYERQSSNCFIQRTCLINSWINTSHRPSASLKNLRLLRLLSVRMPVMPIVALPQLGLINICNSKKQMASSSFREYFCWAHPTKNISKVAQYQE